MAGSHEDYYRLIRRIPKGRVATYGQIAALAGLPGNSRQVGFALNALPGDGDVPWHRVVNAKGRISPRSRGDRHVEQRELLEREGVRFSAAGIISIRDFLWRPRISSNRQTT